MPIPEEMVFMADTAIQVAAIARGALVLEEPLFYYRYHERNLYAIDPNDRAKLRRKYEMAEMVYARVYGLLIELGVSSESVSTLLSDTLVAAKRSRLRTFGGSRSEVFQTEIQDFLTAYKNPSAGYRLFKYLIVGAATFLLGPRHFYRLRDWYAERQLGRYRDRVFRDNLAPSLRDRDSVRDQTQ